MSIRVRSLSAAALLGGVLVLASPIPASGAAFTVDTTDDTVDVNIGDGTCADAGGDCSLRAAVQEANASAGADSITLGAGTYTLDVGSNAEDAAAQGDLDITSNISIAGAGPTITTTLADRLFDVKAGGTLNLTGLTLDGGVASGMPPEGASGGAIINSGTLATLNVEFTDNVASRAGGAIEVNAGATATTITTSTFTNNSTGSAPGNGGAIHITGAATVTITGSTFDNNRATSEGGALWVSAAGTMDVTDSQIVDGRAAGVAADNGGGGLFNDGGILTVTGSTVSGNEASGTAGSGGGIFSAGATTITDSTIEGNTASLDGGGIEAVAGSTTTVSGTTIADNATGAAPGSGGGAHVRGNATFEISASVVEGNNAFTHGGGLWISDSGTMLVHTTEITGNEVTEDGGGLYNDGGVLRVSDSLVLDNTAGEGGGAFAANEADTRLTHVTVTGNEAFTGSGVSSTVDGSINRLYDSIVAGNIGSDDCGGTIGSIGGNVVGDCVISDTGDITGVDDPLLDADFVPTAASPAIDRALDDTTADFAGTVRPLDGDGTATADSGALEAPGAPPTTTTTTTTTSTSTTLPDTETTVTTAPIQPTTTAGSGALGSGGSGGIGGGSLPRTGSSPAPLVALGLTLLTLGGVVVLTRRLVTVRSRR